jgi:nucleoside-diphosphate-sugar epimerase
VRALVHYNARGSIGALRFADPSTVAAVDVVAGDIRDAHATRTYIRGMEVVFHLAALIGIPYSYVAPASYVATNVEGTVNILEASRAESVERIVTTSTSETYGSAQYTPIDEKHPVAAQSPYAATKVAADQLALSYNRTYSLPVVLVRPFNAFGPRQSERAIIPTIVTQAIYQDGRVRLGSLHPRRDLTYVGDTVNGFILLAERPEAIGRATNLGLGESRSVAQMVEGVGRVLGRRLEVAEDLNRVRPERSEVTELCADASFARSMGWQPQTTFEKGVEHVVQFIRTHGRDAVGVQLGYRT